MTEGRSRNELQDDAVQHRSSTGCVSSPLRR